MESQIPQHVRVTTDRRSNKVGMELVYGHEAFIRIIWTRDEAIAIAGALAEAAHELLPTPESAEKPAHVES
jgi:hypothetical protein